MTYRLRMGIPAMLKCSDLLIGTFIAIGLLFVWPTIAAANSPANDGPTIDRQSLSGKRFQFYWKSADGGASNGIALLQADGVIKGIGDP